MQEFLTETEK